MPSLADAPIPLPIPDAVPGAAPDPAPRSLSRDDILRLGRAGTPWPFLRTAARALAIAPQDSALRALAGANLTRLGLRTLAMAQFGALPSAAARDPGLSALRAAAERLPPDEVPAPEAIENCRKNVAALASRGVDLAAALAIWTASAGAWRWFRAGDGNVLRLRSGEESNLSAAALLADLIAAARGFAAEHFAVEARREQAAIVEGADPPWLLREMLDGAPTRPDGYTPMVFLVQADAAELLDGLALADLSDHLRQTRIKAFVGPDATTRLREHLLTRLTRQLPQSVVPAATLRAPASPTPAWVLTEAHQRQQEEHMRLAALAHAHYGPLGRGHWRARFEASRQPEGLRILIPTCRYSTFVRHASDDLAHAFRRLGAAVKLLQEPDAHSRLGSPAYLREFANFRPDLVVLINYTRANVNAVGEVIPANVPFVCWLQDAMPHQFDERRGAAAGPLDFLVGHVHRELVEQFGYPADRSFSMPVVASAAKFHDGPVESALYSRFECDVAFVSHHSEPPEPMHRRLLAECAGDRVMHDACAMLLPAIGEAVRHCMHRCAAPDLRRAADEALRAVTGRDPDPQRAAVIHRSYCLPLADRVFRHETLAWTADLCARRGWRFHLYGRGWERSEHFGRFARGELRHGEELRAAYAAAGAHLHASLSAVTHQRVMECALSGGLPLARLHRDALTGATGRAQRAAALGGEPTLHDPRFARPGYDRLACADVARVADILERLGLDPDSFRFVPEKRLRHFRQSPDACPIENDPSWLLGDLPETCFWSAATLELRIERAVRDAAWRRETSGAIAARVRERLTHDTLAQRILALVRDSLDRPGAEGTAQPAAADSPALSAAA